MSGRISGRSLEFGSGEEEAHGTEQWGSGENSGADVRDGFPEIRASVGWILLARSSSEKGQGSPEVWRRSDGWMCRRKLGSGRRTSLDALSEGSEKKADGGVRRRADHQLEGILEARVNGAL